MGIFYLVLQKLKAFRMTIPSLILLVLASYRTLNSGDSIQLVGICASIVPFICQFKNFPKAEGVSAIQDVISSYILNWILMFAYLAWIMLMTWIGKTFVASYVVNPYFMEMTLIAICADVVFISAVIPICRELKPMQRMIPALAMINAMLIFMMMAGAYLKAAAPANIPVIACGFIANIVILTFGLIFAGYGERKKK